MEAIAEIHPSLAYPLAVLALLVFLAGVGKAVVMPIFRALRQVSQFLDDWYGREEDSDRPGIRERLTSMETLVTEVHKQTHINGGASLKDVVVRTEQKVTDLGTQFSAHRIEAAARDRRIAAMEQSRHDCHDKEQP